jgi:hypothetical protein
MRCASLFVLAVAALSTGCAALVAKTGRDPEGLTPERVTREFDTPVATSNQDGTSTLTFRTHQKIAEPGRSDELMTADFLSFGLAELVYVPRELYRATRTTFLGREIMVRYDALGRVYSVMVDGTPVYHKPYTPHEIEPGANANAGPEQARPAGGP